MKIIKKLDQNLDTIHPIDGLRLKNNRFNYVSTYESVENQNDIFFDKIEGWNFLRIFTLK